MKFIDEAVIEAHAGKGGAGASHFRREKFVPYGGPDGGNGGNGGSVVLVADENVQTLLDFRYQPLWRAKNGTPGAGQQKDGASADDLLIPVPVGTQVYSHSTEDNEGDLIADLDHSGRQVILLKGGRGGKGNAFFKSATKQAPTHAQKGEPGGHGKFKLSLKLVADVGLVGFPNAGKSTLIARISAAKPKIADYPFTTLTPNLGVVKMREHGSLVVADIPGLIEGAHSGRGLGTQFLKHIERACVLAHLIDAIEPGGAGSELNAWQAYQAIRTELENFSQLLRAKKQLVVITKIDALPDPDLLNSVLAPFKEHNLPVLAISSVSGANLDQLIDQLWALAHT